MWNHHPVWYLSTWNACEKNPATWDQPCPFLLYVSTKVQLTNAAKSPSKWHQKLNIIKFLCPLICIFNKKKLFEASSIIWYHFRPPHFFSVGKKKLPSCGVSLCFGFTSLACRSPGGGVKVQGDPADSYHTVALFDPPWNYPKLQPCSWVGYHVGNVGIITNEIGRSLLRYILCRVGINLPVHDVFWGWKKSRQVLDKGIVLQDLYTW